MKVLFTARHFKASEELQERIQGEIDRLEKYFERMTRCHVVLDAQKKSRQMAEITVGMRGHTLVAKAEAAQMSKAFDEAVAKIERQIKKMSEKGRERRKNKPLSELGAETEESEENE